MINRAALVTYIRVQHVENHVENLWISPGEVVLGTDVALVDRELTPGIF